jgi:hypothetical protein
MFDLLRIRQARRAAYAALGPFVDRSVADGPAPQAGDWLQPQIIGFLATAVTVIALRTSGALRSHALAAVQSHVLSALTGIGPELIGEEICLLSSRRDPAFAAGAIGALAFVEAQPTPSRQDAADDGFERAEGGRRMLDALWDEHVGNCLRRAHALG